MNWNHRCAGLAVPLALLVAGCQTNEPQSFNAVERRVSEPVEFDIPGDAGSHLGGDADFARRALEEFKKTGEAPIVQRAGFVIWPFGETYPVLYCKPLRVCDIELQAGEQVLNVAFGDTTRWISELAYSEWQGEVVPHILVKPRDYDISANLIVLTNRRTYHIGLISRQNDRGEYVRNARFYYPRETIAKWNQAVRERDRGGLLNKLFPKAPSPTVDLEDAFLGYEISTEGRRKPRWAPVAVFDDGKRTFIEFPEGVAAGGGDSAPILLVQEGADLAVRNYRVFKNRYVVDGLFETALLVKGKTRVRVSRQEKLSTPVRKRKRVGMGRRR